jgi:hypothetical protein
VTTGSVKVLGLTGQPGRTLDFNIIRCISSQRPSHAPQAVATTLRLIRVPYNYRPVLTIQKNGLFEAIRKANLDPALFKLDESGRALTTVRVTGLPLEFEIRRSDDNFDSLTFRFRQFAPEWPYRRPPKPRNYAKLEPERRAFIDEEITAGWTPADKWCSFAELAAAFREWLQMHVRPALANATAPDLWSEAAASLPEFEELPSEDSERFSEEEQQQLRAAIAHFKTLIEREFVPDAEQVRELNARLDYLADAASRLNRFDWKSLALATIIGAATTLSLDTQTGRQLWALFREALRTVSHLLGP